jgi:hypothetical protein
LAWANATRSAANFVALEVIALDARPDRPARQIANVDNVAR